MKKFLCVVILGAVALAASSAQAAVTIDLGNTTGQANANVLDGPDGNARTYSGTDGSQAFSVRATGWSISSSTSTITNAFLGAYSNGGLGVTNQTEGTGSNNTHTIDNSVKYDFVVLQFNRQVVLDQAQFKSISGGDTDATLGFGTTAAAWNVSPAWNNANASVLNPVFTTKFDSIGPALDNSRNINPNSAAANIWMISAIRPTSVYDDSFKLRGITLFVPPPVPSVPEPATWIMMLIGFGAVGAMMRRRDKADRIAFA